MTSSYWFDRIAENLPLALAKYLELEIDKFENTEELLREVARSFPFLMHIALNDHLRCLHYREKHHAYDFLRSGFSLSFLLFTHELAASGIVGDAPVSLIFKDNMGTNADLQQRYIHQVETVDSLTHRNYGPDVAFQSGFRKTYIGFPYTHDLLTYNSIGDVYFDHDIQVALHKRQFGKQLTEEEEAFRGLLEDCERHNPFKRHFCLRTPPPRHDILFTRRAIVKVARLKENLVCGEVLYTKGVFEDSESNEPARPAVEFESDKYVFEDCFDLPESISDKTIIEIKIKAAEL